MRTLYLIALSGLSLLALYPVGRYSTGSLFSTVFFLHLAVHLLALCFAMKTVFAVFVQSKKGMILFLLGIAAPIGYLILLSLAPVISRDALIHHLAVPKMWLQAGAIHEIPWHTWSYFPMLLQLGFTGFVKLGFPELTALYHGSFLILLASVIVTILKERKISQGLVQLGALLVFTTPLLFRLGASPYVDLPLCVYGAGALYLLVREQREYSNDLLLLGVLLGLSAGVKYNGLLFSAITLALIPCIQLRHGVAGLRNFGVVSLVFILVAFPWYLNNYLLTGNPVFPLLGNIFPPQNALPEVPQSALASALPVSLLQDPVDFLSLPFQMILFGRDDSPSGFDGVLSPLYLFAFLAPFAWKHKKLVGFGCILSVLYTVAALELSGARTRYLVPILGIVIVLVICTFEQLMTFLSKKAAALTLTLLLFLQCIAGVYYGISLIQKREILPVLLREKSANRYLHEKVSESLLADAINAKLPADSKIYLLHTGNRYFLYDHQVINSGYFSDQLLLQWIKQSNTISIAESFRSAEVTHIAFHKARYERAFKEYIKDKLVTNEELTRWNAFVTEDFSPQYEIGPYVIGKVK